MTAVIIKANDRELIKEIKKIVIYRPCVDAKDEIKRLKWIFKNAEEASTQNNYSHLTNIILSLVEQVEFESYLWG